ncbi:MAG: SprB repeat-containing protein, partial [Bacteroidetes bacterium]|nr:SprB repeat-containing protein [Bacteroidota bacterium]
MLGQAPTCSMSTDLSPSCFGTCDGQITVTVNGNDPTYNVDWSDGKFTTGIAEGGTDVNNGICAGTYTVTVTDNGGLTGTCSTGVTEPTELVSTVVSTPISCTNGSDGTATIFGLGGTLPYTYDWVDDGNQTDQTITGLSPGFHNVLVTDANGCQAIDLVVLTNPAPLSGFVTTTDLLCNGVCNGTATFNHLGGEEGTPVSYTWDPSGQVGITAAFLCQGTHTVTVTTDNGCQQSFSGAIAEPTPLTIAITIATQPLCFNDLTGSVCVFVQGGTVFSGTYNYKWNMSPGITSCASGLLGNNIVPTSVTVTDDNGCMVTADTLISNPPFLSVITGGINPSCNSNNNGGICDGYVNAIASGGTGSIFYAWSANAFFQTNDTAFSLCAGTYTVTPTDQNGCTATAEATIFEPSALVVSYVLTNSTCGNSNGSIQITPAGGKGPIYSVLWSNGTTNFILDAVLSGVYCVTVVDGNNCQINECYALADISGPTVQGATHTD